PMAADGQAPIRFMRSGDLRQGVAPLLSLQPLSGPRRLAAAVEDGVHAHQIVLHRVVDCEREALREATVVAKYDLVNTCVKKQGVDIREQAIEKIGAESGAALLVKMESVD